MVHCYRPILAASSMLLALLSGCTVSPCCVNQLSEYAVRPDIASNCVTPGTPCTLPPRMATAAPTKFTAVGYGSTSSYPQYTTGQQKMMAMRAAQLDAYRNLAEQVQGFRISGNSTVSAFTMQNDVIHSYVDAFIRGARIVGINAIADGNYQANVELEISNQFLECVLGLTNCVVRVPSNMCAGAGCTLPSSTYFSY